MQKINFLVLLAATVIPLIVGFIWYNKNVFGKAWMKATGVTEESAKGANMFVIFGLTILFSFMISMILQMMVIHQFSVFSILANEPGIMDPNSELGSWLTGFMAKYGNNFRTFKHGAFHGVIAGLFFAMPVIAINALFERRGFKYIAITSGYFIVSLALMGGVICQFA